MKNLGMGGRNNTRARAPRYGFAAMSILRWRGEAAGEWICVQPLSHFFASPRIRPEFIENSYADDSDVLGVAIFRGGGRFANRSDTKGRDRRGALSKALNLQWRLGRHESTRFPHRVYPAGRDIGRVVDQDI